MTKEAQTMIREWLNGRTDKQAIEQVAQFMARTLRLGRLPECRQLVLEAIGQ